MMSDFIFRKKRMTEAVDVGVSGVAILQIMGSFLEEKRENDEGKMRAMIGLGRNEYQCQNAKI